MFITKTLLKYMKSILRRLESFYDYDNDKCCAVGFNHGTTDYLVNERLYGFS